MTASNTSSGPLPASETVASGPTTSPWLRILGVSSAASAVLLVVLSAAAAIVSGWNAGLSALFGGAIVLLFFGVSLLIGHFVGRSNPSGALGIFVVVYAIKVVGFAAALFALGRPEWLHAAWFFSAAVASVVVWQIAEVIAFSRTRYLLYNDEADASPITHDAGDDRPARKGGAEHA